MTGPTLKKGMQLVQARGRRRSPARSIRSRTSPRAGPPARPSSGSEAGSWRRPGRTGSPSSTSTWRPTFRRPGDDRRDPPGGDQGHGPDLRTQEVRSPGAQHQDRDLGDGDGTGDGHRFGDPGEIDDSRFKLPPPSRPWSRPSRAIPGSRMPRKATSERASRIERRGRGDAPRPRPWEPSPSRTPIRPRRAVLRPEVVDDRAATAVLARHLAAMGGADRRHHLDQVEGLVELGGTATEFAADPAEGGFLVRRRFPASSWRSASTAPPAGGGHLRRKATPITARQAEEFRRSFDFQALVEPRPKVQRSPHAAGGGGRPTPCDVALVEDGEERLKLLFDQATGLVRAIEIVDASNDCVDGWSSSRGRICWPFLDPGPPHRAAEIHPHRPVFSVVFDDVAEASFEPPASSGRRTWSSESGDHAGHDQALRGPDRGGCGGPGGAEGSLCGFLGPNVRAARPSG